MGARQEAIDADAVEHHQDGHQGDESGAERARGVTLAQPCDGA
jgi:hypothetical protein